ncbi:DUF1361 domain-containing protein [Lentilactobacillus kosonis]
MLHLIFLVLNTFLAFIPIELSFHIDKKRPHNPILFWVIVIIWLLFYPNTPYLLTDLFHLSLLQPYGSNGLLRLNNYMWFNYALLMISTISSTVLGFWGLDRVAKAIADRLHMHHLVFTNVVIVILTILSSIGIFIGRFLRIHTIYLFLTPEQFIKPLLNMWSSSALLFIGLLTIIQLLFFYLIKLIQLNHFQDE